MKLLVAGLVIVMSYTFGQASPLNGETQCRPVFKVDATLYANTKDEKVDNVTVCENGSATAFHSFTGPAFGAVAPEPTKWSYSSQMDTDELSDIKRIIERPDIAQLPENVSVEDSRSHLYVLMRFTILNHGTEKTITLHVPLLECGDVPEGESKSVRDLVCLYAELASHVKSGMPTESSCGCKSLREMATTQHH
jgi:hypothetical protein